MRENGPVVWSHAGSEVVHLPHDALRSLNPRARARTVVEQILGGPEVPGDQNASDNAEHALAALVHEGQWYTFAFVRLGLIARRSSWSVLCADPRWQVSCAPGGGMRAAWAERHVAGSAALAT